MRLWTIQGIEIYEQLQHKGAISLRKDKRFCRKLVQQLIISYICGHKDKLTKWEQEKNCAKGF